MHVLCAHCRHHTHTHTTTTPTQYTQHMSVLTLISAEIFSTSNSLFDNPHISNKAVLLAPGVISGYTESRMPCTCLSVR